MTEMVTITCPCCGFSRGCSAAALPTGAVRVTCPKCKQSFVWERPSGGGSVRPEAAPLTSPVAAATAQTGATDEVAAAANEVVDSPAAAFSQGTAGGDGAVGKMLSIGELFNNSWTTYQKRFPTLMALMLAILILLLIPVGIFLAIGYLCSISFPELKTPLLIASGFTGGIIGTATMTWGFVAFNCAVVDQSLRANEALEQGWRLFIPVAWVYAIISYIVCGGYFLFLIPGIIFSVLFAFSQFICIAEGERGLAAVIKSRRYVQGYGGEVFARMIVIWITSGAVGMVPFVGGFISILFIPFTTIYTCLLYEDLRRLKGDTLGPVTVTREEKMLWLGLPALGYLLLPLILALFFGAALIGLFSQLLSP